MSMITSHTYLPSTNAYRCEIDGKVAFERAKVLCKYDESSIHKLHASKFGRDYACLATVYSTIADHQFHKFSFKICSFDTLKDHVKSNLRQIELPYAKENSNRQVFLSAMSALEKYTTAKASQQTRNSNQSCGESMIQFWKRDVQQPLPRLKDTLFCTNRKIPTEYTKRSFFCIEHHNVARALDLLMTLLTEILTSVNNNDANVPDWASTNIVNDRKRKRLMAEGETQHAKDVAEREKDDLERERKREKERERENERREYNS